jgi:DNA-binding NarL/FixJ family response regulator
VRTVLVCVRTPLAAQNVAAVAARLGLGGAVRTAISDPEVMLRLAERPADVVLADTGLTRPDTVGFTRRVMARSPGATLLLLGPEEQGVAAAAISAGARGLVQGADHDLTSVVAKAIMLLVAPRRTTAGSGPGAGGPVAGGPAPRRPGVPDPAPRRPDAPDPAPRRGTTRPAGATTPVAVPAVGNGDRPPAGPPEAGHRRGESGAAPDGADQATVVPAQRGDEVPGAEPESGPANGAREQPGRPASAGGFPAGAPDPRANAATEVRLGGVSRGDPVNSGAYGRLTAQSGVDPARRITLTEREMQVLVGMADGKSNAEIGRELFVSEDTVKTHARRLFRKLGARDRAHAVAAGFRAGLVA